MNLRFLLLALISSVSLISLSQTVYKGTVESVLSYGSDEYSYISEDASDNYYKTSPHKTNELVIGQRVDLVVSNEGTSSETIEVKAASLTDKLYCQRTSHNNMKMSSDSIDFSKYVSYNEEHDVLVFDTWEDLERLETKIFDLNLNYPYNRGNDNQIFNLLDSIQQYGWHNLDYNNGNEVSLKDFKTLLNKSYPLSTDVLTRLFQLLESKDINYNFCLDILSKNLPYSSSLEFLIDHSKIDSIQKSELIRINDEHLDSPNHAYSDFLSTFPKFNSLYSDFKTDRLRKLQSGMDPGSQEFDDSYVDILFDKLIMNNKHEVWIEGNLFKMYSECLAIALEDPVEDSYQSLALLDENGGVVGSYNEEEPVTGIPDSELEQIVPSNYIVYNPMEFDPLGGAEDDPYYNTALQEYNIVSGCPKSNFTYSLYAGGDLKVDFHDQTNFSNAQYSENAFMQYWKFGDGTGSFQDNPTHEFPDYGTYDVSLATFIADCGCWHVHSATVTILEPELKEGNPLCPISSVEPTPHWSNDPLSVQVHVEPGVPNDPNNFVVKYEYTYYTEAGTQVHYKDNGNLNFHFQDFVDEGVYYVVVKATWDNGCVSISDQHEFTLFVPVPELEGECDQYHKVKDTYYADYEGDEYRLKIKDVARGTWGTTSWRKIHGQQTLYRKKSSQWTWKVYSAWQEIHRTGYYYEECDIGHYLEDNGAFKSCYGETYVWMSPGLSFPEQFGLGEGSVKFNHKVYIYGAMVTQDDWSQPDLFEQDYYNCHNPWGHLLFNRNVWVGQP